MTRRLFHHLGLVLVPVVYGGGMVLAALRFLLPIPERRQSRIEVGTLVDFKPGVVKKVEFNRRLVYVLHDGDNLRAFDAECTHLACNVHVRGLPSCDGCDAGDPDEILFHCPCHGGRFDRKGTATRKPPVLPLKEYQLADPGGAGGKVIVLDKVKTG